MTVTITTFVNNSRFNVTVANSQTKESFHILPKNTVNTNVALPIVDKGVQCLTFTLSNQGNPLSMSYVWDFNYVLYFNGYTDIAQPVISDRQLRWELNDNGIISYTVIGGGANYDVDCCKYQLKGYTTFIQIYNLKNINFFSRNQLNTISISQSSTISINNSIIRESIIQVSESRKPFWAVWVKEEIELEKQHHYWV
ncbi:hypothetical protein PPL_06311 [Heterostelium album PN500]|uniref:Uncharacterized protein n=1 Tax=Heterostelium pallidum (strain ATCC 26659 / Pp 5 / PN500) TaxID=670386 RepID=D3BCT3_HETP5|nr:hypothetical protein PPL_06311 [Heterostelium album PN500]EFA80725.1 hypothetical protein PPL_06311 [Heterostelium album PN500]|eukprot:XP_020432845.1 hypothetical protein PPL_06311 [Heterostelium album PN500]